MPNQNKEKIAVFFDRDGVICNHVPYLHKKSDFQLRPNVGNALKKLNEHGIQSFLVTNQPMVAMGMISIEELHSLHNYMNELLELEGAKFTEIFFCPHSPDPRGSGTPDTKYIKICNCRKPKNGMFIQATNKYDLNPMKSYMVGDSWRDYLFAINSGLNFIGVRKGDGFNDPKSGKNYENEIKNIFDETFLAIEYIVKNSGL